MYKLDFDNPVHIHFIGIGGISMSGLAEILLDSGFTVSGSDNRESELTRRLAGLGARISIGQCAENIPDDTAAVVYTAAIHPENPEYTAAVSRELPLMSRAELLGQLMRGYSSSIAVSGTHGKTTTTSMIAQILLQDGEDPTVSVGGMLPSIGGNIRVGGRGMFLTEACEYTNSFLSFYPSVGVILNIEEDHMDFFKDLDDIRHSFALFAKNISDDGALVICADIPDYRRITEGLKCSVITFGKNPDADYGADEVSYDQTGRPSFTLLKKHKNAGRISLSVPGEHNIMNALAAAATADFCGISFENTAAGLFGFTGTDRRFQYRGRVNGFAVIDDYAHHPTEIRATLNAAKRLPHGEIWCVFQPHTYSRTKAFLPEFVDALSLADHVVLADIYAARETDTLGVSSKDIAGLIAQSGRDARYLPNFEEIAEFLKKSVKPGDICITMGAGSITDVGDLLLS